MAALVKRRAEPLGRRTGDGKKRTEYLAFVLAGDTYAVRIGVVAEILKPPPITEVPRAPSPIVGVVSVRGRLVTVLDLRRRFNLPEAPFDHRTRILLVDVGENELAGLLVDEVLQVYRLAEDEIEPAQVLGGDQPAHIVGIGRPQAPGAPGARRGDGVILILLDLRSTIET